MLTYNINIMSIIYTYNYNYFRNQMLIIIMKELSIYRELKTHYLIYIAIIELIYISLLYMWKIIDKW